jgi:hypothetical protein
MLRFLFGVITGYLVFAISGALWFQLAGQNPHATPSLLFGIASVLYGIVFAVIAGFVATRTAGRADLAASMVVGVVIGAGALASLLLDRQHAIWSQVSALLLMAPGAYAGGVVYRKLHR